MINTFSTEYENIHREFKMLLASYGPHMYALSHELTDKLDLPLGSPGMDNPEPPLGKDMQKKKRQGEILCQGS